MLPTQEQDREHVIEGKEFTEPYRQSLELVGSAEITVAQTPYFLDRAECLTLTTGGHPSKFTDVAINLFAAWIGVTLLLIIRYLMALQNNQPVPIEAWELVSSGILLVVSGVFYYLGEHTESKKKALLKKMNDHFEASPRTIEIKKANP